MSDTIKFLLIPSDLTSISLLGAVRIYLTEFDNWPSSLVVSSADEKTAEEIAKVNGVPLCSVYCVHGLPDSAWILCGKEGLVYSPGA